ncbi:hypothetical protein ACJRO7_005801 [Eucalyptus globulus]|uniref:Thionin-like protein n=1 Tax=Eucalyptus globulus TaxID=34317 RepID=A0ABD3J3T2_EUCGL
MDKVKPVFILCLGLGLFLGQATADAEFLGCYARCFVICCLNHCIHPLSEFSNDPQYFCKLGCAFSSCSNLSSKDNPNEKAVAGCVDSCLDPCTDHV